MRGHLAIVVGLIAACTSTAPEALHRPGQRSEPPRARVEARALPALRTVPPELARIADEVRPEELTPAMRRLLPPRPFVVSPGRPPAGGDALALADRALHQGDARDAITQLLPLSTSANRDVATYARWRLGRAYLEVGDAARGEALLREVAASHRPEAWAALVLLAESIAARHGAEKTLMRLEPLLAGALATRDELERVVLRIGPARSRATVFLERAARVSDDRPCALELAALVLDRSLTRNVRVKACMWRLRTRLARSRLPAEVEAAFASSLRAERPHQRLADATWRWRALDRRTRSGTGTSVEDWVALSVQLIDVTSESTSPVWGPSRQGALDALANAALRAVEGMPVSLPALHDAFEVRDALRATDRERADAITHALFERRTAEPDPDLE